MSKQNTSQQTIITIKKIQEIKYRAFRSFSWNKSSNKLEDFIDRNLIYGWNGSGKSTLTKLFKWIEACKAKSHESDQSTPHKIPKNDTENNTHHFECQTNNNTVLSFKDGSLTTSLDSKEIPNVRVFNEDYVKQNIWFESTGTDDTEDTAGKTKLPSDSTLILGQYSIQERNREEAKSTCEGSIKHYATEIDKINKELDKLISQQVTHINKKIHDATKIVSFTNRKLVTSICEEIYLNPSKQENLWASIDINHNLNILRLKKDPLPPPPELDKLYSLCQKPINALNLKELHQQAQTILRTEIKTPDIPRLEKQDVRDWVHTGLDLHKNSQQSKKTCLFCTNEIAPTTLKELDEYFKAIESNLKTDIQNLTSTIEATKSHTQALTNQALPKDFRTLTKPEKFTESLKELKAWCGDTGKLTQYLNALSEILNEKKSNPTDMSAKLTAAFTKHVHAPSPDAPPEAQTPTDIQALELQRLDEVEKDIQRIINEIQTIINEHNKIIANQKKEIEEATKQCTRYYLLHPDNNAFNNNYTNKQNDIKSQETKQKEIREQLKTVEEELKQAKAKAVLRHVHNLTEDIKAFFPTEKLSFTQTSPDTNKYTVFRNGKQAVGLSTGERSCIALLYFLRSLNPASPSSSATAQNGTQAETPHNTFSSTVVVIDDPVSSLDTNCVHTANAFIRARTQGVAQLFILTHHYPYFCLVKDWFTTQGKANKGRMYLLHKEPDQTSRIEPLPKTLKHYKSEYHYLFSLLYNYRDNSSKDPDAQLQESYLIGNVARRVLESFLSFQIPFLPDSNLYKQLRKLLDTEDPTLLKPHYRLLCKALNDFSHKEDCCTEQTHDPTDFAKTMPEVIQTLLDMIKKYAPSHFTGMKTLCDQPTNEQP